MSDEVKTILIIEGPSGCGKSTLTGDWLKGSGIPIIKSSLQGRVFDIQEAALLSTANDALKLAQALVNPAPVVIIERWLMSQLVYHQLRIGNIEPLQTDWESFLPPLDDVVGREVNYAINSTYLRGGLFPERTIISISWLCLLPDTDVLMARRSVANSNGESRHYPWDPDLERMMYRSAMIHFLNQGMDMASPKYAEPADGLQLARQITDWATVISGNQTQFSLWEGLKTTPIPEGVWPDANLS